MKKSFIKYHFIIFLFCIPQIIFSQVDFDRHFTGKTMRFDYLLGGNHNSVQVYPVQIKQEPYWAGSRTQLTDSLGYGTYRFSVFDKEKGTLLFSKGFCTLFQEWQTTSEAKTINKTFYQALMFPFPKHKVRLEIEARQWEGHFKNIYTTEIDPDDYFIIREKPDEYPFKKILDNGPPEVKVDLVILSEGYNQHEQSKFITDCERVTEFLFNEEPFKQEKSSFNVTAVFVPSQESGTDVPGENVYNNTAFHSSFYTFDVPRYLTTSAMKEIYDATAFVPADHVYVLVNTERYGGGGFYNLLSVCSSGNSLTAEVFVHEFGHGLAGLGDEYYTSSVAYENYYNLQIEPWEPNLTTMIDFEKKWKSMVSKETKISTPREMKYHNTIGVFEGGGYLEKGIYSPYMDCRMKSNTAEGFCPVCREAIKKVISLYTR